MRYQDRYASAIRSSCLTVGAQNRLSDADILGAAGLAAKTHPLAIALLRLFMGDNSGVETIVAVLADMTWKKARHFHARLSRADAELVAQACLAWHRDGACKHCGGHGFRRIPGTTTLGTQPCPQCAGEGRVPLERQFSTQAAKDLARWLVSELERETGRAAAVASRRLGLATAG